MVSPDRKHGILQHVEAIAAFILQLDDPFVADPASYEFVKFSCLNIGVPPLVLSSGRFPYLPIEWLRPPKSAEVVSPDRSPLVIFRSSGTSSADRSQSPFSEAGLELYRVASQAVFRFILKRLFGQDCSRIQGFSFVPDVRHLPDSSLATMVRWFGEQQPMVYSHPRTFSDKLFAGSRTPIWLFGTAAHFLELFATKEKKALPAGSHIFCTGGFKNMSVDWSEEEFSFRLASALAIETEYVHFEYGMCELATPAWRLGGSDGYRFPSWVKPTIEREPFLLEAEGRGALCVDDPLRIDFQNRLRTQDLVELAGSGSFSLLGRVPHAPLKGCSLSFVETANTSAAKALPRIVVASRPKIEVSRVERVFHCCRRLLTSSKYFDSITREFGSNAIAEMVQQDILAEFPNDSRDLADAVLRSEAQSAPYFVICPSSHTLATLVPLVLLACGSPEVNVRVPEVFLKDSSLTILIGALQEVGIPISAIDPRLRLEVANQLSEDCIVFGFGSDQTREQLTRIFPNAAFFGTLVTISLIEPAAGSDPEQISAIGKDLMALRRRGCMSSRCIIVEGKLAGAEFMNLIASVGEAASFWEPPALALGEEVALTQELLKFVDRGMNFKRIGQLHFVFCEDDQPSLSFLHDLLPGSEYLIPVIQCSRARTLLDDWVGSELLLVSRKAPGYVDNASGSRGQVHHAISGTANRCRWDGTHLGRPFFSRSSI